MSLDKNNIKSDSKFHIIKHIYAVSQYKGGGVISGKPALFIFILVILRGFKHNMIAIDYSKFGSKVIACAVNLARQMGIYITPTLFIPPFIIILLLNNLQGCSLFSNKRHQNLIVYSLIFISIWSWKTNWRFFIDKPD